MAASLRISLIEMLLMRGMAETTGWHKGQGGKWWVNDFDCSAHVGRRNLQRAIDKGVENGMIEYGQSQKLEDGTQTAEIRLTSLGERILKAAEPKSYELYLKGTRQAK